MITCLKTLDPNKLNTLIFFADQIYNNSLNPIDDLKINLTRSDLLTFIGSEAVIELETIFGERYDQILIRRC